MPAVFEYSVQAQTADADLVGHVNNVVYLRGLQDAASAHSTTQGWSPADYLSHGCGWVARSHLIEYLGPAFPGEELIITEEQRPIAQLRLQGKPPKRPAPGLGKGSVLFMSPDFDEPLEEMQDYSR